MPSIIQQTEVLEDREGVAGGGTERLCCRVQKSYRFKLILDDSGLVCRHDIGASIVEGECEDGRYGVGQRVKGHECTGHQPPVAVEAEDAA